MASLVDSLERRKQLSGLSSRELQALKDARKADRDSRPGSIAYEMNQRAALQDQQLAQFLADQSARQAQALETIDRQNREREARRGGRLIGQENIRGGGGGQQGIIGAQRQDAPPEYIYRDLKSGEEYDPRTDVFFENEKGALHRRKVVNPEYQDWVVRRAEEIARENMAKNAGSGQGATRVPDARVLAEYQAVLEARRKANGKPEAADLDRIIAAFHKSYPQLAGGGGTGGAGGGVDVTGEQAVQELQKAGVPPEVATKIIGQEIGKVRPKPTWDWQSEVSVDDTTTRGTQQGLLRP